MRIIYVDVDSLRADHTEPYGYNRRITPNLAAFAKDAVVFDRYYCSDSPCVPSRAALTSGQFGITNGVVGHYGKAAEMRFEGVTNGKGHYMHPKDRPLLGGHLGRHGIYPASVSCFAERHLAYWFYGNFRESIRPSWSLGQDEDARDVNNAAFDWLQRNGRRDDWFLHLNYWEPHTWYIEPMEWFEKASRVGPPPDWPDAEAIAAHKKLYGPRTPRDLAYLDGGTSPRPEVYPDAIETTADVEKLVNGYDGEIYYWDHRFGQLLDRLGELGILDDTAIIVSADHGESLGENGSYSEHGFATEPVHHIPLLVKWPGITDKLRDEQRRCDAMLYNIDLAPTLCDLLGIEVPGGWQGTSFADAIRGEPIAGRPWLVFGQGAHTFQRAVRTRDYLYVRTLHPGCIEVEPEQLFNVSADPHLTRNLIASESELAGSLKAHLSDWWHTYAGFPGALPDPMQAALVEGPDLYTKPPAYIRHLEETGRKDAARALRRRLRKP